MTLSPLADFGYDFVAAVWPGVVFVGCLLAAALVLAASRRIWRSLRTAEQWINEQLQALPAPAADNQVDTDVLTASNQTRKETP
ncbi:hypothetical protein [Streptomyces sp. NPDC086519]|uniref:hypothetical protein n=1 Tax=Streptomyces sp. NPDC086519 TaxID=3154863 RepID=UPI0034396CFC